MIKYNDYLYKKNGFVFVETMPIQKDDIPYHSTRTPKQLEIEQKKIDICLNCTKEKCNGNCKQIRGIR